MNTNMNMIDYVKKAVLENYANFNGRATRPEYWWFFLFNLLLSFVLNFLAYAVPFLGIISSLVSLALFIPSLAVGVRRLHDVGKSGWFILIPIYNLILLATEGQSGTNEYGPDPRNPVQTFDFDKPNYPA